MSSLARGLYQLTPENTITPYFPEAGASHMEKQCIVQV